MPMMPEQMVSIPATPMQVPFSAPAMPMPGPRPAVPMAAPTGKRVLLEYGATGTGV